MIDALVAGINFGLQAINASDELLNTLQIDKRLQIKLSKLEAEKATLVLFTFDASDLETKPKYLRIENKWMLHVKIPLYDDGLDLHGDIQKDDHIFSNYYPVILKVPSRTEPSAQIFDSKVFKMEKPYYEWPSIIKPSSILVNTGTSIRVVSSKNASQHKKPLKKIELLVNPRHLYLRIRILYEGSYQQDDFNTRVKFLEGVSGVFFDPPFRHEDPCANPSQFVSQITWAGEGGNPYENHGYYWNEALVSVGEAFDAKLWVNEVFIRGFSGTEKIWWEERSGHVAVEIYEKKSDKLIGTAQEVFTVKPHSVFDKIDTQTCQPMDTAFNIIVQHSEVPAKTSIFIRSNSESL